MSIIKAFNTFVVILYISFSNPSKSRMKTNLSAVSNCGEPDSKRGEPKSKCGERSCKYWLPELAISQPVERSVRAGIIFFFKKMVTGIQFYHL